jgi:hypothetical protein
MGLPIRKILPLHDHAKPELFRLEQTRAFCVGDIAIPPPLAFVLALIPRGRSVHQQSSFDILLTILCRPSTYNFEDG